MAANLDPRGDYLFKRLFGDEDQAPLLVALLNALLDFPAGRAVRGVTLLNPFVASDYAQSKVPILDVRARDDPGRLFLVEMQRFVRAGFDKRLLFYWSGGYADQLLKGERYEMLQPAYLICFLDRPWFAGDIYHHRFRVYDQEHGVLLCKDLEIHVLELSKFNVPVEEVKTPEQRWCYFLKHGASLDLATLPATLDDPMIRQALEVLMKLSQDELERQRALEWERIRRDAASLAEDARVARQVGFDEGLEKGQQIGRIHLLQQLLSQPETASAELKRLAEEDLIQLEESLKRQLSTLKRANGTPPTDPA
jgi:predicted transposase/invertase (TIGR01784 family)